MLLRMRRRVTPNTKSEATRHLALKIATALERVAAILERCAPEQPAEAETSSNDRTPLRYGSLHEGDVANLTKAFERGIRTLGTLGLEIVTTSETLDSTPSQNS